MKAEGLTGEISYQEKPPNREEALTKYMAGRRAAGLGFEIEHMEAMSGLGPPQINQRIQAYLIKFEHQVKRW